MQGLTVTPLIILMIVLLGVAAFFSLSETALMSVSRVRLRQLQKKRPLQVRIVESLLEKPEKVIATILFGNNLANIALSAVATFVATTFWGQAGILYVTVGLTIIVFIFTENTPKIYARYHSDTVSLLTAPVLKVFMSIFQPVVTSVTWIARKLLLPLGMDINKTKRKMVTEAEVREAINISWEDGGITAEERDMLSRIFTLNDKPVSVVMVPRKRMVTLRSDYTIDQALNTIKRHRYSRYPVRKGDSQEFIGFIHAKDLLGKKGNTKLGSMKKLIRTPYFIPADKKINRQLRSFKSQRLHQAIVLDNKGAVKGLVTLEDILEQMVGSIEDEYDT